ncbi:MAG: SIMPL domain-containing protein [Flavobacteriaceae bacterium]
MKKIVLLLTITFFGVNFAQTKNFIDQPYLETTAKVDTLVTPDQIYLSIYIHEGEDRNRTSLEKQERKVAAVLENLGIDLKKQLKLDNLASNYKKYFLKRKNVLKSKSYTLQVYDAMTAGNALIGLEDEGISNVRLIKTAYSKIESLKLDLKSKAILKAQAQAEALTKPLNQLLGKAIHINDKYFSRPYYYDNRRIAARADYAIEETVETPIDIEFSKIKVESEVSVRFAIN